MEISNIDLLSIYYLAVGLYICPHRLQEEASLAVTNKALTIIRNHLKTDVFILRVFSFTLALWTTPTSSVPPLLWNIL